MAKRKAKESAGEGVTAVADPLPPETVAMSPEEVAAVRKELDDAKKRIRALEKRNKAIVDKEKEVESWKRELDYLTASINETRKAWKDSVEALQKEITRQERQAELPFDETRQYGEGKPAATAPSEPAAPPVDTALATKLSDVAGFSESIRDKLGTIDVTTVGELEQAMRDGKIVPQRVKGLGEKAISVITEALRLFRFQHPVEVDTRPKRCRCGAEYPGELTACPTCEGTFYERVEPDAPTPAVETALAEKAAVDESTKGPEAGTVFDPKARAA